MIRCFTIRQDNLYKLETRFITTSWLMFNRKREGMGKPLNVYFSLKLRKMRYKYSYRRNALKNHVSVFISIFYYFFIWKKLEKESRISLYLSREILAGGATGLDGKISFQTVRHHFTLALEYIVAFYSFTEKLPFL